MIRRIVALVVLLLLTGCGLPLERGVQVPAAVGPDERQPLGIEKLPPGPLPDQTPIQVVRGFLDAQASAEDGHAIARQFLAPEAQESWDDAAGVTVYAEQLDLDGTNDDAAAAVQATGTLTATLAPDGSYRPADGALSETYRLRMVEGVGWRLTAVPTGLRISVGDLQDSFAPSDLYYLARGPGPEEHLAADRAFLPVEDDRVPGLVRRLLRGPSETLRGAVDSALTGAALRSASTDQSGVVTVDLGLPDPPSPRQLRRMSAQLVWTLRGAGPAFVQLRLLVDGRPAQVDGIEGDTQPRSAWASYDPDGLTVRAPGFYLDDRRLQTVDSPLPPGAVDRTADLAAVSPRGGLLALLADVGGGRWEVRTGPLSGPLPARADYSAQELSSPSWGSGNAGLWLLAGERPRVVLLDGVARDVPLDAPPGLGRLFALRVSRDGVRIALVAGDTPETRRVWVGTIERPTAVDVRITRLRPVGEGVTDVTDVAWESGTMLVAVGRVTAATGQLEPLPLRLAVDGSGPVELLRLLGLGGRVPSTLAAAPGRPLLVAATEQGGRIVLRDQAGVLVGPVDGYAPFYPG